jgi:4-hydroxybenzoate polyprenyltransferase
MAGCALAAAWIGIAPPLRIFYAAGCSVLFLYAYGLVLNDIVDIRADRKNRTGRPLAEGTISVVVAAPVAALMAAVGIGLAYLGGREMFWAALALLVAATAYNLALKRFTLFGALGMGICRALGVLVGLAGMQTIAPPVWLAAIGTGVFIGAVTWIADHEDEFFDFGRMAYIPMVGYAGALVSAGALSLLGDPGERFLYAMIPAALGIIRIAYLGGVLTGGTTAPGVTQRTVGSLIRALIPMQAAFLLMGHGLLPTVAAIVLVVVAWPAARILSHRFYAS